MIAAGALVVAPASHQMATMAAAVDPPAQIAGTWILNKDLGSDPLGELDTSRPHRPYGAGGMAVPGTGTGLGGPLMGGRRAQDRADQEELAKVKEMLRVTMAAPAKIEIDVDGPAIEIVGDDGTVTLLRECIGPLAFASDDRDLMPGFAPLPRHALAQISAAKDELGHSILPGAF